MWAGFFCRQDVSISIFGRTKEFSEVRGTSVMCNFGVRSRFFDVIYGVRPPNGSPDRTFNYASGGAEASNIGDALSKIFKELAKIKERIDSVEISNHESSSRSESRPQKLSLIWVDNLKMCVV